MGRIKEAQIIEVEFNKVSALAESPDSTRQILDLMVYVSKCRSDFAASGIRDHILRMFYFMEIGDFKSYRELREVVVSFMKNDSSAGEFQNAI